MLSLVAHFFYLWPDLNYGDIIYDQPNKDLFWNKIENVQYEAAKVIEHTIC